MLKCDRAPTQPSSYSDKCASKINSNSGPYTAYSELWLQIECRVRQRYSKSIMHVSHCGWLLPQTICSQGLKLQHLTFGAAWVGSLLVFMAHFHGLVGHVTNHSPPFRLGRYPDFHIVTPSTYPGIDGITNTARKGALTPQEKTIGSLTRMLIKLAQTNSKNQTTN